jgi:hypothetical protein
MDIQDSSAAIYSEAKSEYTRQLVINFQPVLLRFFLDRFNETKNSPAVVSRTKSALSEFQESLSEIPDWNIDKVQRETSLLLQAINCDYIEDLITAVFIAHTKILSAIRLHSKPRRKINITVPKPEHFIHRTMSESSRLLWSNVYLFNDNAPSLEQQKNVNEVNKILEEGLLQAIRNLLPVKSILRDNLQDDDDDVVVNTPKEPDVPTEQKELEAPKELEALTEVKELEAPKEPKELELPKELEAPKESDDLDKPDLVTANNTKQNTFVIDTEKSVGFTGIDSVFGTSGEAELRPSADEADELKILGDLEELDLDEIEDLNPIPTTLTPLGADDYETL